MDIFCTTCTLSAEDGCAPHGCCRQRKCWVGAGSYGPPHSFACLLRSLQVEPARGIVPAHGHVTIAITFEPLSLTTEEGVIQVCSGWG